MKKQKVILFDIDYTLFDVAKFRKKIFQSIAGVIGKNRAEGIEKTLEKIYYTSRDKIGYFKMTSFLKDVNKKLKMNVLLTNILKNEMFSDNLYEETKGVLKLISKNHSVKIGIFSGGESGFQLKKIEQIESFFHKDHVHIIKYKHLNVSKIIKKYKDFQVYLVDDVLNILHNAKKIDKSVVTIWIKRGRFAEQEKGFADLKPDFEIRNLKEIIPIVESSKF